MSRDTDYTWELFDPSLAGRHLDEPRVSVRSQGLFSINELAFRMLAGPARVLLGYDARHKAVGIIPAPEDDARGMPVVVRQDARSKKIAASVSARTFMKTHGINPAKSYAVVPFMAGNALVVRLQGAELSGAIQEIARRQRARTSQAAEA